MKPYAFFNFIDNTIYLKENDYMGTLDERLIFGKGVRVKDFKEVFFLLRDNPNACSYYRPRILEIFNVYYGDYPEELL